MGVLNENTKMGAAAAGGGGYEIEKSLRFDRPSSTYLERSSMNVSTSYLTSCWVKRSNLGLTSNSVANMRYVYRFGAEDHMGFQGDDSLNVEVKSNDYCNTERYCRDVSNWMHIVVRNDGQGSSNSLRLYVNGVEHDYSDGGSYDRTSSGNARNVNFRIGAHEGGGSIYDGYVAEFHFVDGQGTGLPYPSDFGEFDEDYGHWKPIEYTGSHGSNGFYLDFANSLTQHTITRIGSVHSTSAAMIGSSSIDVTGTYGFSIADSPDWSPSGDFTYEMWIYMNGSQASWSNICGQMDSTNRGLEIGPDGSGNWMARHSLKGNLMVTQPSTNNWHHLAFCRQGNTARLYLNGTQVDTDTGYTGSLNNCADVLLFGNADAGFSQNFNGYLDEIRFSKVCRYPDGTTFTNFGQGGGTISNPTAFTSDDDTLLLIHSNTSNGSTAIEDSSGIGKTLGSDASANSNHFTLNNISSHDQTTDTPTNNWCTFNNLQDNVHHVGHYGHGNLEGGGKTSSYFHMGSIGTMHTTNKIYYEVYISNQDGGDFLIGIAPDNYNPSSSPSNDAVTNKPGKNFDGACFSAAYNTVYYDRSSTLSLTDSASTGDLWGVAFDPATGKFWIHKNGTWLSSGNPSTGANPLVTLTNLTTPGGVAYSWTPCVGEYQLASRIILNCGQEGTFLGNVTAGGNSDSEDIGNFKYAVPSGFKALCSKNLSDPAVIPSENFNTVLYTGTGSSQTITTGFDTDLVWVKNRGRASEPVLVDTLRGDGVVLHPDRYNGETSPTGAPSLISTGFTVSSNDDWYNRSSDTYVSWNWKGNGAGSSNTEGTITGTVSANTSAGFSIITWTGSGSAGTLGHGLSKAPNLVIIKRRNSTDEWVVGSIQSTLSMDFTDFLELDTSDAVGDNTYFNDTAPTSTVFSVGTDGRVNTSSAPYVAYCFHDVEGYSKIGSYQGTSNANGTCVHTGFRPAMVIIKNVTQSGNHWVMFDNARSPLNPHTKFLFASDSAVENTSNGNNLDFLSNGFKLRKSDGWYNHGNLSLIHI